MGQAAMGTRKRGIGAVREVEARRVPVAAGGSGGRRER